MTTSSKENIIFEIDTLLKSNDLAEIANKSFDRWQSCVFYGVDNRFNLSKNRGRLPYLEYEIFSSEFNQTDADGGQNSLMCRLRINIKGHDKLKAQIFASKMISKFIKTFRMTDIGRVVTIGESEDEIENLPFGFAVNFTFEINIGYNKNEYGWEE